MCLKEYKKSFIIILNILILFIVSYYPLSKEFESFFTKDNLKYFNSSIISNENSNILDIKNNKKSNFNPNIKCVPTDNKIYWNNETDLESEKNIDEIINSKSLKISFDNKTHFYKRKNPKISIIITVFNQGVYIKEAYAHIQKQELKDIEIIFVDDASTDNSSLIINELMEKDKRIVYLKNDINRNQFYSINKGVLESTGEYILSIDPDDFLLNNILIKAYETAKFYDLDIIEFYMFWGLSLWDVKYKSGIICNNSNVRDVFYFGGTRNLPDKLVKREIYINAINYMPKDLYYENYHAHTDDTIFFGLIHFANSYGFLEQVGYFYNIKPNRRTKIYLDKREKVNSEIRSLFNIMKYFMIKSDENLIEKNNMPFKFFIKKVKGILKRDMKYLTKGFDFFIEVFNLYLACQFFKQEQKDIIIKFKRKFIFKKRYYKYKN